MRTRGAPLMCKRRGCAAARERWQLVCAACWAELPWADRNRYARARKAKLTRIAAGLGRALIRSLGRKPADAPLTPSPTRNASPSATETYARNCALLGERDRDEDGGATACT